MVKIQLQISCQLESIQSLKTCDNYSYFVKLKCSNCGESSDLWHDFCEDERTNKDSKNPKGSNLSIKCKLCNRVNSMDVLEKSQASYLEVDAGKFKGIVTFDCRGIEPLDFDPRSGFIVKSLDGGNTFEDVEIEDGDWSDYDERLSCSVSITEFQSQFIKLKGK